MLTQTAKDVVEGAFPPVWVRGEISDFKAHRNGHWYFYKPATRTWVKVATKGAAWRKAKPQTVAPTAKGAWTGKLGHLKTGALFVRTSGADLAGNDSNPSTTKAVLTSL